MHRFNLDTEDEEILAVVDHWADLLAAGEYSKAHTVTFNPSELGWTPDTIEKWIHGYGFDEPLSDGTVMQVTPRETAIQIDVKPYREILRANCDAELRLSSSKGYKYGSYESLLNSSDGFVGEVWYSLPLNGEWSDLVARFDLAPLDGFLVLVLVRLDVP